MTMNTITKAMKMVMSPHHINCHFFGYISSKVVAEYYGTCSVSFLFIKKFHIVGLLNYLSTSIYFMLEAA